MDSPIERWLHLVAVEAIQFETGELGIVFRPLAREGEIPFSDASFRPIVAVEFHFDQWRVTYDEYSSVEAGCIDVAFSADVEAGTNRRIERPEKVKIIYLSGGGEKTHTFKNG